MIVSPCSIERVNFLLIHTFEGSVSMRFQYAFVHEITGFEGARDSTIPLFHESIIPRFCPRMKVESCPARNYELAWRVTKQRSVPEQL
jgi:hypothetical protein